MKPPFLRTQYNYDRDEVSQETGLACKDKTLTQQHFRDECDINILFARYLETGEMPQVTDGLSYGNFEGIYDFQTAMNAVRTAEGLFNQLPARIKNRFSNDPQKMLEFLADENNREEAEFLGLVNKPQPQGAPDEPGTGKVPPSGAQKTAQPDGAAAGKSTPDAAQKP